jgi:hypothetical protein
VPDLVLAQEDTTVARDQLAQRTALKDLETSPMKSRPIKNEADGLLHDI